MNTETTAAEVVGSSGEVRPYATSVTWRNELGGSWQQWHDDDDPMPDEWDDRPPDEVVHVYTAEQVAEMMAAAHERCDMLLIQRDSLRDALRKVLDAGNAEAKARMSWQNANENFSSSSHEAKQHERAMLAASDAEREARVLLLTLRDGLSCERVMSDGQACGLKPPCPDCGRACHDVPEGA